MGVLRALWAWLEHLWQGVWCLRGEPYLLASREVEVGVKVYLGIHRWHMRWMRPSHIARALYRAQYTVQSASTDPDLHNAYLAVVHADTDPEAKRMLVWVALEVDAAHTAPLRREAIVAALADLQTGMAQWDREGAPNW